LNPLIKVMNLVAVLIAPTVVALGDETVLRLLVALVAIAILAWALRRSSRMGGVALATPEDEATLPNQPDPRPSQRSVS
ncbi:MAG TPA: hypothetical protein VK942_13770, partial [Actinomycetes bacterium]|nr:hypothetical protein [Actinomycetes bacterium]